MLQPLLPRISVKPQSGIHGDARLRFDGQQGCYLGENQLEWSDSRNLMYLVVVRVLDYVRIQVPFRWMVSDKRTPCVESSAIESLNLSVALQMVGHFKHIPHSQDSTCVLKELRSALISVIGEQVYQDCVNECTIGDECTPNRIGGNTFERYGFHQLREAIGNNDQISVITLGPY